MQEMKRLYMKRILIIAISVLFVGSVMAIPPEKVWREVTMADGSKAKVMLVGDEWAHYLMTDDGRVVDGLSDGSYVYVDKDSLLAEIARRKTVHSLQRKQMQQVRMARRATRGVSMAAQEETDISPNRAIYRGSKKGIVILVEFPDKTFSSTSSEPTTYYTNMLNQNGFGDDFCPGSVHDYFHDMSTGMFDLTFDVYGPVTVSKNSTYYGGSRLSKSSDLYGIQHAGEFICEAVKLANSSYDIDWTKYDWDKDGEIEEVFVMYAGYGSATGGSGGTLWPHMSHLDYQKQYYNDGPGTMKYDGVEINVYACGNELYGGSGSRKMGLGVFCHEFSHCMGLPDMYDTGEDDNRGMDTWDLMDYGSYNGVNGSCPAPWTPWERHFAGWLDYTELQENDSVTDFRPLLDEAKAYVIYNDNNRNEYYTLHNIGVGRWDAGLSSSGLFITHVDYDEDFFQNNIVNTTGSWETTDGGTMTNDHERMSPVGRRFGWDYYETYPMHYGTVLIDSLTDNSNPAASLWNANTDGSLLMHKPVYDIAYDSTTGYVSFNYMPKANASGIEDILTDADGSSTEMYDITGMKVSADESVLRPGIYIVRNGQTSKKILIK